MSWIDDEEPTGYYYGVQCAPGNGLPAAPYNNCTVARNSANVRGGGTRSAIVYNSIVCENWAPNDANYSFEFGGSRA